jgi:hypothetical protein
MRKSQVCFGRRFCLLLRHQRSLKSFKMRTVTITGSFRSGISGLLRREPRPGSKSHRLALATSFRPKQTPTAPGLPVDDRLRSNVSRTLPGRPVGQPTSSWGQSLIGISASKPPSTMIRRCAESLREGG